MGLFSRKKPAQKKSAGPRVVRVAYRGFGADVPDENFGGAYEFAWVLDKQPEVGDRIWVPGVDGIAPGVVIGFGGNGSHGGPLKAVKRLATAEEIAGRYVTEARPGAKAVRVEFIELAQRMPRSAKGYDFGWRLAKEPEIGDRVWVPGPDGLRPACVVGLGRGGHAHEFSRQSVKRLATEDEIKASNVERIIRANRAKKQARERQGD